ncbi:uncharacterized protein LOC132240874 isoform X4 [Myotis daubentonii]|uniref:uncharacterized protein LOC132240874 isoform X4 n=1 Tax=Myotis daubentonii TaxID=98922 RepID=UPI0028730DA9|nr:uncharacterized protein LOC132240874 isoform X4 [Myotis daubentonii]
MPLRCPAEHEEPNEGTGFGGERCVGTSCPPYTEARTALEVAVETPVIEESYLSSSCSSSLRRSMRHSSENSSKTMWIPATERNSQECSSHEDKSKNNPGMEDTEDALPC